VDTEKLRNLVFHGSPLTSALALTILDEELEGKIGELAKILRSKEGDQ
jgi:hypothetical protein